MSNELATVPTAPKASDQLASFLGIEKSMMLETLKAQCFKGKSPDQVTDAQLAAFVSTANVLQVNPLVPGMLYAYPERNGGITPILGPDGTFKKLDEMVSSGKLMGFECDVTMGADGKPESATAIIYRVGEQKPAKYTAYYSEWSVTSNPNWQARPRHMLWVRAIKQAARQVIHGLPMDADEYQIAQMANVTPEEVAPAPVRPSPPPRAKKGAAAVAENAPATKTVGPEVAGEIVSETVATPPPEPAPKTNGAGMVVADEAKNKALSERLAAEAQQADQLPAGVHGDAAEADQYTASKRAAETSAQPVGSRAFLHDLETLETTIRVKDLKCSVMKSGDATFPTAKASVTGGYVGDIYHKGGAKLVSTAPDVYEPLPPWKVGAELKVTLLGQKNAKGMVVAYVQSVEAVQDEF